VSSSAASTEATGGAGGWWRARRAGLAPLAFFILLAVAHTWPLASAPGHWSRHDNPDPVLNEWAMAWIAHQLPRDPLNLFHANIFYPERRTLAFSEHLIVQGVMGLPLALAGASPLLVHNLVLLAGFVLTAWSMYFVVARWTGDVAAGVLAGALAAFNAHSFSRIPHIQAVHVQFLPLAILLLDRLLVAPRWTIAVLLGVCVALQGLTSYYWLIFTGLAIAAALAARPDDWFGPRVRRLLWPAALALASCALVLAPFLWTYYQVSASLGVTRVLDEVALFSGGWQDYLISSGRWHFATWSHIIWGPGGRTPLFPGVVATLLALVALVLGPIGERRVRMWLAILVCAVVFSFGTRFPGYAALYDWLPPLHGIRAPVRAGHLALIALAALAGFGLAAVRGRVGPRARLAVFIAALTLVTAEAWVAPIRYFPGRQPARVAAFLANEPAATVVALPFPAPHRTFANAQYMIDSTRHWRPMLNGYSGLLPPSYARHWEALQDFPSPAAFQYLRDRGVTHAIVYHSGAPPSAAAGELEPMGSGGGVTVFRIRPGGPGPAGR
jgi:hypothetical protein